VGLKTGTRWRPRRRRVIKTLGWWMHFIHRPTRPGRGSFFSRAICQPFHTRLLILSVTRTYLSNGYIFFLHTCYPIM
jgi:hypothetical protein